MTGPAASQRVIRPLPVETGPPYASKLAQASISDVPEEIIFLIFQYLSPQDLLKVKGVCHTWKNLALDDSFWKPVCTKIFGRALCRELVQKSNVSFHDAIMRQKQVEAALRRSSEKDFPLGNLANMTGMEPAEFHPSEMAFYDDKIYFCRNTFRWFYQEDPTLRICDRKTSRYKDIPLKLKVEGSYLFGKTYSIQAITSDYLIMRYCEKRMFSTSKFCVYDRMTETYLWESENREYCFQVKPSVQNVCIFSSFWSEEKKAEIIRARDLRTGHILFETSGKPFQAIGILSGLLMLIDKNQDGTEEKRIVYLGKKDEGKKEFVTVQCKRFSNINSAGDVIYQQFDNEVILLKLEEAGYIQISFGQREAKRFWLSENSLWYCTDLNPKTIIKIDHNEDSISFQRKYEHSRLELFENCFKEGLSSQYSGEEITIYDAVTGEELVAFAASDRPKILGFENHLMIVAVKTPDWDLIRIKIFDIKSKRLCRDFPIPARTYESFYKNGMLFFKGYLSWFDLIFQWHYFDVARDLPFSAAPHKQLKK